MHPWKAYEVSCEVLMKGIAASWQSSPEWWLAGLAATLAVVLAIGAVALKVRRRANA